MTGASNRLDLELLSRGYVQSRAKAQMMISEKRVRINGALADKPSRKVSSDDKIDIETREIEWVGRGALKLIAALDHFGFDPGDRIAADIGASTGGFSQVLLHRGARKVYAVDVGHGQLHQTLIDDRRLINLENTNARYLSAQQIEEPLDFVVSDVSFISLKKILPAALALCKQGAQIAVLVKPQFEVGKGNLGKGGVVRDPELTEQVRLDMEQWISSQPGWHCKGSIESPVKGSDGNREFLLGATFDD